MQPPQEPERVVVTMDEAADAKLTALLQGRILGPSTSNAKDQTILNLTDGSKVFIKTATMVGTAGITGGKIASASQRDTKLTIVFANGHHIDFFLVAPTESVTVQNKDSNIEYANG